VWLAGTWALLLAPPSQAYRLAAYSTANDALSVLPKEPSRAFDGSTVGYSTVPSLGSWGRRVKAKGVAGLEEAHTWSLA
jgi:hypothetical protein